MPEKTESTAGSTAGSGFTFSGLNTHTDVTNPAPEAARAESHVQESDKAESVGLEAMTQGLEAQPEAKPEETEGKKEEGSEATEELKAPAWMAQLPEDLRADEDLKAFQKLGDFAKAYKELASKKDGLQIPGKDAKPEEVEAFYRQLGKPEKADGYKLTGENIDAFKNLAYSLNLTQNQAEQMYNSLNKLGSVMQKSKEQQLKETYANTNNELKAEYGNAYGEKMKLLQKGLQTYGGKDILQKLNSAGLSYDLDVVHMFIKLGEMVQEAGSQSKAGTADSYKSNRQGGMFTFKGL